ncbi:hypothetical protein [Bowmanella denitrificans]|uniref:hypothetical protein n=1 Tax=Bowmanella denitrificans TaxID=366582 RepID=UPI000C9D0D8D|nr:hypothetical protein [Bowmanella denitrificans]
MTNMRQLFFVLFTISALTSCSSTLDTSGPISFADSNKENNIQDGFKYYLSKDLIKISATKSVTTQKVLNVALEIEPVENKQISYSNLTVSKVNKKDSSYTYWLDLSMRALMDSHLIIEAENTGVLKTINGNSQGKAGDVLHSTLDVISSVSTIAGFLSVDEVTVEKIEGKLENSAHLNEISEVKKRNDSESDKNAFKQYFSPLLELSRAELLMVIKSQSAFTLWQKRQSIKEAINNLKQSILNLQSSISSSTDLEEISKKIKVLALYQATLGQLNDEQAILVQQWQSSTDTFKSQLGLTASTTTTNHEMFFELDEIPPLNKIESGKSKVELLKALNSLVESDSKFTKMKSFHDASGLVISIDPKAHISSSVADILYNEVSSKIANDYGETPVVFYRQREPIELNIHTMKSTSDEEKVALIYNNKLDLVLPGPSTSFIAYDESTFADSTMILTFSSQGDGVLTKAEKRSTASANAATTALNEGISSAVANLGTISEGINKFKENERKIAKHDLLLEYERLTEEKKILDARISLDAGTASEQDLIDKKTLDSTLDKLQSQYNLDNQIASQESNLQASVAQVQLSALNAQLNLAKAQGNFENNIAVSQLESQLSLLTAQLNADKAGDSFENNRKIASLQSQVSLLTAQLNADKAKKGYATELESHLTTINNNLKTILNTGQNQAQINAMQSEIELLKKEIELIRARRELEEVRAQD